MAHATGNSILEVVAGWQPAEIAGVAIAKAQEGFYCVVLDLAKLNLTPAAAIAWLEEYNATVSSLAPHFGLKPPFPTVAVLAHGIDAAATDALRSKSAVVFDRAIPSNERLTGSEALAEVLANLEARAGEARQRGEHSKHHRDRVARPLDGENLKALNSYPDEVTRDSLTEMLKRINEDD